MTKFVRIAGVLAALWLRPISGAPITFAVVPGSGLITVSAGGFNGWGFEIKDSTSFVVIDSTTFNLVSLDGVPESGSFPIGTYTDLTPNLFLVVGPGGFANGTDVIQAFTAGISPNPATDLGAGEIVTNPGVAVGTDVKGNIVFTYDIFSDSPNDPNFDPDLDTVASGVTASVPVEVDVTPEPASILLLGSSLAALLLLAAVRRARRSRVSLP